MIEIAFQVGKQLGIIGDEIEFRQVSSKGQVGGRRPAIIQLLRKVFTRFSLKHITFIVLCAGYVYIDNLQKNLIRVIC